MKQCLFEHPNSYYIALNMARILDSHMQMMEIEREARYDDFVLESYLRTLESEQANLQASAAEALYYHHFKNEQYEKAEAYLTYFSQENDRKHKQALIYQKTERVPEAYSLYEEIVYAGYQSLSDALSGLYILALHEGEIEKARWLIEKKQGLAKLLEFGEYHEVSVVLELAQIEKNVEETLYVMERMLNNLESIAGFTKSQMYEHMKFRSVSEDYLAEIRNDLQKSFGDEESFGYLKEDARWQVLVGQR
jgi:hypothetical protein